MTEPVPENAAPHDNRAGRVERRFDHLNRRAHRRAVRG